MWGWHEQAKWITSPQIERSFCVRELGPPAGVQTGQEGGVCVGVNERLSSFIYRRSKRAGSDRLQLSAAGREI